MLERVEKGRCGERVGRYLNTKEIMKRLRKNLPPPLQANSPLLYVLISSITCAAWLPLAFDPVALQSEMQCPNTTLSGCPGKISLAMLV